MSDFDHGGPPRSRPPRPFGKLPGGRRAPQSEAKRPPWLAPRRLQDWPETSCGCDDCQEACLSSPGWFLPEQVERVADYLNLTLEALFRKYLAVSVAELADGSRRHGVMPHKLRDHKRPGGLWTLPELAEPGRCVFFDRGKCGIYPVRPFECSRMIHSHRKELKTLRRQVVERWTREELRFYERLIGRKLFPKHMPAGESASGPPRHHAGPQARRGHPGDQRGAGQKAAPEGGRPGGHGRGAGRGRRPARGGSPQRAPEPPVDRNPHELPSPVQRAHGPGGRPGGQGRRFKPARRRTLDFDDD